MEKRVPAFKRPMDEEDEELVKNVGKEENGE